MVPRNLARWNHGTEFTPKALGHLTPSAYAKAGQKRSGEVTKFQFGTVYKRGLRRKQRYS